LLTGQAAQGLNRPFPGPLNRCGRFLRPSPPLLSCSDATPRLSSVGLVVVGCVVRGLVLFGRPGVGVCEVLLPPTGQRDTRAGSDRKTYVPHQPTGPPRDIRAHCCAVSGTELHSVCQDQGGAGASRQGASSSAVWPSMPLGVPVACGPPSVRRRGLADRAGDAAAHSLSRRVTSLLPSGTDRTAAEHVHGGIVRGPLRNPG